MQNQPQKITIEVIESKNFRVAARGYDQHEVDEFLDSICDEMEHMEDEMAALKQDLELEKQRKADAAPSAAVPAALAEEKPAENTFREILEIAQRVKDQTIADAQAQAAEILANARNEVAARFGSLGEERKKLVAEVEELRAAVQTYREQLAALIASGQEALAASDR